MIENGLGDSCTFGFIEEFVAELNNVVAIAIADELVNIEGHIDDYLFSYAFDILIIVLCFALELSQSAHHMLDHTHRVLVQGKSHQILCYEVEQVYGIIKRERFDDFLYEMSGVVIETQVVELLVYGHHCVHELLV